MIGESELAAVDGRLATASGDRWVLGGAAGGIGVVRVVFGDGREEVLRVTRDRAPASPEDVDFIAHARRDLEHLTAALRSGHALAAEESGEIQARCARASPAPWTVFLEQDGGVGGSNVIRVSDDDGEPDLYLWLGDDLAPNADFELVAAARQDVPQLLAAAKLTGK